MSGDGLPAETEPPVSEDLRQRGIDYLQELLASGKVDLDRFQTDLDALLGVHTQAGFASVVRSLPAPSNSRRPHGSVRSRSRSLPRWARFASRVAGR